MKLPPALTIARNLLAALVAIGALAIPSVLYYAVLRHRLPAAEQASAVWGALMLVSFAGWGSGLNALVFPRRRADLGLRLAWGWAITLALGGVLCALSLAGRRGLFGLVWGGILVGWTQLASGLQRWASRERPFLRRRRALLFGADLPLFLGATAILALAGAAAFASLINPAYNVNDDPLAYFQFAREIIEAGTLTQPFSLRRISSYSGKSLLDALQLAIDVPETHLNLLDKGLGLLTLLALLLGHARTARRSGRGLILLGMLYTLFLPDTAINSSTMRTGAVVFLGLYRTLAWAPVAEGRGFRPAVPVALLAAAACTLRQNFLVTIAAILVLAYGRPLVRSLRLHLPAGLPGRAGWKAPRLEIDRDAVRDAAVTAGLLVLFLVPWWVMAQRWCGTFLFPLRKGNYDTSYSFFPSYSLAEWLRYIWQNLSYLLPVKSLPLFLAAALTMRGRTARAPFVAVTLGAFIGYFGLLFGYSNADYLNQGRYHFGFTYAAILAIVLAAADLAAQRAPKGRLRAEQMVAVPLVVVALSVQLYEDREASSSTYKGVIERITHILPAWSVPAPDPTFQKLQEVVPAGAPIASMVDTPSHFDHHRNRIACLDMIGAISPRPGIPLAQGGDAVADYLQGLGYRYVVVIAPDKAASLYRRDIWQKQQKNSDPVWMKSAHYYLESFDDFDDLKKTRVHLAEAGNMVTLDLATRQP